MPAILATPDIAQLTQKTEHALERHHHQPGQQRRRHQ